MSNKVDSLDILDLVQTGCWGKAEGVAALTSDTDPPRLADGTGQAGGGPRPRPVGKKVGAGLGWSERPWGSIVGLR